MMIQKNVIIMKFKTNRSDSYPNRSNGRNPSQFRSITYTPSIPQTNPNMWNM